MKGPVASAPPAVGAAVMCGVASTGSGKPESTAIDNFVSAVALDARAAHRAHAASRWHDAGAKRSACEAESLHLVDGRWLFRVTPPQGLEPVWRAGPGHRFDRHGHTRDLRPFSFFLMAGSGRIEVLARMARLESQRCQ